MCGAELDVPWYLLEMSTKQAVLHGEIDPRKECLVLIESFEGKCIPLGEDVFERNLEIFATNLESKYYDTRELTFQGPIFDKRFSLKRPRQKHALLWKDT